MDYSGDGGERNMLIYEMGHGTFVVSLLSIEDGIFDMGHGTFVVSLLSIEDGIFDMGDGTFVVSLLTIEDGIFGVKELHASVVLSVGTKHSFALLSVASTCRSGYQVLFLKSGFCIHIQYYRLCGGEVCVQWTLQNYAALS